MTITGLNKPNLGFLRSFTNTHAPLCRAPEQLSYKFVTHVWVDEIISSGRVVATSFPGFFSDLCLLQA